MRGTSAAPAADAEVGPSMGDQPLPRSEWEATGEREATEWEATGVMGESCRGLAV